MLAPCCAEVFFRADGVAVLAMLFAMLANAIQNALLGLVGSCVLSLAAPPTLVVIVFAIHVVASLMCAILGLAFRLHAIAFRIRPRMLV